MFERASMPLQVEGWLLTEYCWESKAEAAMQLCSWAARPRWEPTTGNQKLKSQLQKILVTEKQVWNSLNRNFDGLKAILDHDLAKFFFALNAFNTRLSDKSVDREIQFSIDDSEKDIEISSWNL